MSSFQFCRISWVSSAATLFYTDRWRRSYSLCGTFGWPVASHFLTSFEVLQFASFPRWLYIRHFYSQPVWCSVQKSSTSNWLLLSNQFFFCLWFQTSMASGTNGSVTHMQQSLFASDFFYYYKIRSIMNIMAVMNRQLSRCLEQGMLGWLLQLLMPFHAL